jgi:hypothetical protein
MRDRLIELIKEAKKHTKNANCDIERNMLFADYLLANGVIVPPCKLGDMMYCDGEYFASHCEGQIMSFPVNLIETKVSSIFRGEPDVCFDFEDFGKTVFLTREAAEQALKGR